MPTPAVESDLGAIADVPASGIVRSFPLEPARTVDPLAGIGATAPVVVTVGYVAPGIEMVLHAMALLRNEHPDLEYVVAGRTHPDVARRDGERYRWCLAALADDLRLADRVHFLDRRVDPVLQERIVMRSDVVVVPYREAAHAITRTTAVSARLGRPVVVTRPCLPSVERSRSTTLPVDVDADEACAAAIAHALARRIERHADVTAPEHPLAG